MVDVFLTYGSNLQLNCQKTKQKTNNFNTKKEIKRLSSLLRGFKRKRIFFSTYYCIQHSNVISILSFLVTFYIKYIFYKTNMVCRNSQNLKLS